MEWPGPADNDQLHAKHFLRKGETTQAIKRVHISDAGRYGRAEVFAEDESLPLLGAIATMQELLAVGLQCVTASPNINNTPNPILQLDP